MIVLARVLSISMPILIGHKIHSALRQRTRLFRASSAPVTRCHRFEALER